MKNFRSVKSELLKDPLVKEEYDALALQFSLASQIMGMRLKQGLTQAQLAELIGTKQAAIARLESGSYNPSIKFLEKVAKGLGVPLTLRFG